MHKRAKEALVEAEAAAQVRYDEIIQAAEAKARQQGAQAAAKIVSDAEAATRTRMQSLEPALAQLVSQTVAQVIGEMDQEEAVRRATSQALFQLREHRRARIRTAPDVLKAVRDAVAHLPADPDGIEILDVQADERLEPGRATLTSDTGHVELGLADQIASATRPWTERTDAPGDPK